MCFFLGDVTGDPSHDLPLVRSMEEPSLFEPEPGLRDTYEPGDLGVRQEIDAAGRLVGVLLAGAGRRSSNRRRARLGLRRDLRAVEPAGRRRNAGGGGPVRRAGRA